MLRTILISFGVACATLVVVAADCDGGEGEGEGEGEGDEKACGDFVPEPSDACIPTCGNRLGVGQPCSKEGGECNDFLDVDGETGAVRLPLEEQERFVADFPAVFAPESGAWGLQGWTRIQLLPAAEESIGEAMTLAWQSALKTPTKPRGRGKKRR